MYRSTLKAWGEAKNTKRKYDAIESAHSIFWASFLFFKWKHLAYVFNQTTSDFPFTLKVRTCGIARKRQPGVKTAHTNCKPKGNTKELGWKASALNPEQRVPTPLYACRGQLFRPSNLPTLFWRELKAISGEGTSFFSFVVSKVWFPWQLTSFPQSQSLTIVDVYAMTIPWTCPEMLFARRNLSGHKAVILLSFDRHKMCPENFSTLDSTASSLKPCGVLALLGPKEDTGSWNMVSDSNDAASLHGLHMLTGCKKAAWSEEDLRSSQRNPKIIQNQLSNECLAPFAVIAPHDLFDCAPYPAGNFPKRTCKEPWF